MKKSYIKYILCLLFWIFFFWNWIAFWACSEDMSAWFRDDLPGNWQQNGQCWSNATQGDDWYNNQNPLPNWADLFLKMIDKTWVECDSQNVASIQRAMQSIWWMCSTCIDWRAWNHMRSAIWNCDLTLMCVWRKVPTLNSTGELVCTDSGYILNGKCCEEDSNSIQIEQYQAKAPEITNYNPWWSWNNADITVDYWKTNDISKFDRWDGNASISIKVDWQTANEVRFWYVNTTWELKLLLKIPILESTQTVIVSVWEWVAVFTWWVNSPLWIKSFTRCEKAPHGNNDCSSYWWMWYFSGATSCCEKGDSCQIQKNSDWWCESPNILDQAGECCIACANPVDNSWNCQSWYTLQWSCCFANNMCWDTWYNVWWQCYACGTWQKPNENHTKCVCDPNVKCCWIKLNTTVPFIWDCIESWPTSRDGSTQVNEVTAFPVLIQWLMKIILSLTLIFSFLMIIVAWFLMTSSAFKDSLYSKWKDIIKKVIISLILLWCSWLILSLINPSFFGW